MRILFVAPSAYLLGGVQDWLHTLCMALRSRGHKIIVGVPDNKFHCLSKYNTVYSGIQAVGFTNKTGTAEGRIRTLCRFILEHPADIIVGVNIGDLYEAYRRVSHRMKHTRIVFSLHAIEANYYADIQEYSCLLDAVITTNRLSQSIVRSLNVLDDGRVFYAPYGIGEQILVDQRKFSDKLTLAWVGRIDNTQKRVSDIVGILRELDREGISYTLSVAGNGPYTDQIQSDLREWTRSGKVHFIGLLNKDQLKYFYARHNILLITSQWETGPIVAWEAMAAGLVVVSSEYIGHSSERALIDDESALLFPIGDYCEACRQIRKLSDVALRERLARKGREIAKKRYSIEASVDKWEGTFKNIMLMEKRMSNSNAIKRKKDLGGRLERLVGVRIGEILRSVLPVRRNAKNPGSEWPHSLQGWTDQTEILSYAQIVEDSLGQGQCLDQRCH